MTNFKLLRAIVYVYVTKLLHLVSDTCGCSHWSNILSCYRSLRRRYIHHH